MTLSQIPMPIILFMIGHAVTAAWAIITMFFEIKAMKIKMDEIEKENAELKKKLSEMADTLLLVKHSVDLLVLGKLKTGNAK